MNHKILFSIAFLISNLAWANHPTLEPLLGHFSTQGGIHIQVRSNGCTYKRHFEIRQEIKGDVRELTFVRKSPDLCKAYLPYGEIISFSFEELGLENGELFAIVNPQSYSRVSEH